MKLENAKIDGEFLKQLHKLACELTKDNWVTFQEMAKKFSESDIGEFVKTKELPPVKLNNSELAMLKGGVICFAIAAGAMASSNKPKSRLSSSCSAVTR